MTQAEEIEVLRWYLHEITVAWDCGDDEAVAALINNVDAHRWCEENGFLVCDQSVRRVFAGAIDFVWASLWAVVIYSIGIGAVSRL